MIVNSTSNSKNLMCTEFLSGDWINMNLVLEGLIVGSLQKVVTNQFTSLIMTD